MNRALAIFLLFFLAAPALGETPSYNFIEAGYVEVDLDFGDGFDVDGDGFGLGGAFEIGDNFFGFASYQDASFDFGVDFSTLEIGLGYHKGISDNTSFFFRVGYADAEISAPGFGSEDESGYSAGIGVRSNVSDLIELALEVAYLDLGDGADDTAIGGAIWFNITDNFALGANVSAGDDVTSYGAGLRLYFGD
jgi:opacity protein-like surface antigen